MLAEATRITAPPVDWLLSEDSPPWVHYWTLRDLLGQHANDPAVLAAHAATVAHPLVQGLITDVAAWPGPPLKRHNDAAHPLHKLAALADFGLTRDDPALAPVIVRVLAGQAAGGAFTIDMLVAERYGGDGQAHARWMLCDAPVTLHALLAFGLGDDPRVRRAISHLTGLLSDNGWPCAADPTYDGFRGPGRKDDPCPYATLVALRALSRVPELVESPFASVGVEMLLWHWDHQRERKLFMFGIGTDFRKSKYPLIWYDMLHVCDVLSRFPQARRDPRFVSPQGGMVSELMWQADEAGRFTPASMYMAWKGWDFADKKQPSPTITAAAWRTYRRVLQEAER